MSYTLYDRLGSGGFVVEAMLALAGVEYKYEPLQSKPNEPIKQLVEHLNPWGQVPMLETADGSLVTEVGAIISYLAYQELTCHDGPHLWVEPKDRALYLRWNVFLSVNVYEGILRQCYPQRYFDPLEDEEMNAKLSVSVKTSAKKRVHEAFLFLENHVIKEKGDFLLSSKLSGCDIYMAMLYAWHNKKADLPKCTEITRRVATHELIQSIWKRNFHDRLDYKWHELSPS